MKGAISVSSLGKCFKHYPAPNHRLIEWFGLSRNPQHQTRWVLRDLNFRIDFVDFKLTLEFGQSSPGRDHIGFALRHHSLLVLAQPA